VLPNDRNRAVNWKDLHWEDFGSAAYDAIGMCQAWKASVNSLKERGLSDRSFDVAVECERPGRIEFIYGYGDTLAEAVADAEAKVKLSFLACYSQMTAPAP
jgi:hypothetical protein